MRARPRCRRSRNAPRAFLADPPADYYPPEKLTATLERVRAQGVEGIVVFSTSGLTSAKLWDTLGAFFGR